MAAGRLQAAAVAAGVEHRLTGHSGRVGLASELTARGASTADVMLAGGWKTSRMGGALLGRCDRRAGLWRGTSDPTSRRLTWGGRDPVEFCKTFY